MSKPPTTAAAPSSVQVDNAQNVNVPGSGTGPVHLPYAKIIATVTAAILGGFALVTWWVVKADSASDPILIGLKGSLIQTWNNLAVMAAGFWLASSLGGKLSSSATQPPGDKGNGQG